MARLKFWLMGAIACLTLAGAAPSADAQYYHHHYYHHHPYHHRSYYRHGHRYYR